jgi:hypothetical protein
MFHGTLLTYDPQVLVMSQIFLSSTWKFLSDRGIVTIGKKEL